MSTCSSEEILTDIMSPLFIFRDGSPVKAEHVRATLRWALTKLGLDPNFYGIHSLRIGRTTDLAKFNYSLEEIYKYIRDI